MLPIISIGNKISSHNANINDFIINKINEKKQYMYIPTKKHLTIIACHLNSMERINILKQNIHFLSFCNNDIIIINSSQLPFNEFVQTEFQDKIKEYFEIPNDKWLDFGKWKYILNNFDYSVYDFITFTNDSFYIHQPICFFYNLATLKNKELYGYTSSSEIKYHYQSYLFTLKKDAVFKLKDFLDYEMTPKITVIYLEINLIHLFSTKDCFLDVGNISINHKKNIFFNNSFLYNILLKHHLLPFTKLKKQKLSVYNYNNTSITFSPRH